MAESEMKCFPSQVDQMGCHTAGLQVQGQAGVRQSQYGNTGLMETNPIVDTTCRQR